MKNFDYQKQDRAGQSIEVSTIYSLANGHYGYNEIAKEWKLIQRRKEKGEISARKAAIEWIENRKYLE